MLRQFFLSLLTGVPHMTTEADQFGDYHIPAGSAVLVNVWYVEFGL